MQNITLSPVVALKVKDFPFLSPEDRQNLLKKVRADAKKNFDANRDAVLATLPVSHKNLFNQIGFTKKAKMGLNSRAYVPVLVVNPYSTSPGKARNSWFAAYETVSDVDTKYPLVDTLAYLPFASAA